MKARAIILHAVMAATLATPPAAGPAAAQVVQGRITEQLLPDAAPGAVVVLLRVEGDALASVGMTLTEADGSFWLEAPGPGSYRVQADRDGLTTPLSPLIELTAADQVADVSLVLPSPLLTMALECQAQAPQGSAVVVGRVHDLESGVPLPGIQVSATWMQGVRTRREEATADGAGRYRICGIPADAGTVRFEALALGTWKGQGEVRIASAAMVIHDVPMTLASPGVSELPPDVLGERIILEAAAKGLGDLRGQVVDARTGRPLPFVVVRLQGTSHQALSDEGGRFAFQGLQPGSYTLDLRSIGYQVTTEPLELPPGKDVFVGLRAAPQAVELEGLEVTTRSAVEEVARITPFRRDIAYGEVMAEEEDRGARAFESLRRTAPGLRVTEVYREVGPPTLCVQTNRRIQSLTPRTTQDADRRASLASGLDNIPCDNVQVVVDGVKIPDGAQFLLRTPASEIESLEFITPVQAQILYGVGGDTSNGVVAVWTRGKGPYASPLRNARIR